LVIFLSIKEFKVLGNGFFGHPEVKYISFITLPYAGKTSLSFKYSNLPYFIDIPLKINVIVNNLKVIVTKLKHRSQSAGNFGYFFYKRTSETLSNEPNKIFVHTTAKKDNDFGHYLAGLIEGAGHFSKTPQIVIVFNFLDASLAYFVKSRIGFGNIYKVKHKKAVILVISKLAGIKKVLNLINGKIRSQIKIDQINNNILIHSYFKECDQFSSSTLGLDNH
jgi:hypothetical protein